jgi:hypothetical protein
MVRQSPPRRHRRLASIPASDLRGEGRGHSKAPWIALIGLVAALRPGRGYAIPGIGYGTALDTVTFAAGWGADFDYGVPKPTMRTGWARDIGFASHEVSWLAEDFPYFGGIRSNRRAPQAATGATIPVWRTCQWSACRRLVW